MATIPCLLCLSDHTRRSIRGVTAFLIGPLNLFLFVWFICGIVWVFSTDAEHCNPGLYSGAHLYILFCLLCVPVLLCGVCCIMCCLLGTSMSPVIGQYTDQGHFGNTEYAGNLIHTQERR